LVTIYSFELSVHVGLCIYFIVFPLNLAFCPLQLSSEKLIPRLILLPQ